MQPPRGTFLSYLNVAPTAVRSQALVREIGRGLHSRRGRAKRGKGLPWAEEMLGQRGPDSAQLGAGMLLRPPRQKSWNPDREQHGEEKGPSSAASAMVGGPAFSTGSSPTGQRPLDDQHQSTRPIVEAITVARAAQDSLSLCSVDQRARLPLTGRSRKAWGATAGM